MKLILDQLGALNPKPIEKLTAEEARRQPTMTDAVLALMKKQGMDTKPLPLANVKDGSISAEGRQIPIRIYTPQGTGPFPVLVYVHGGGWVIATIDTYDASARVLSKMASCVVVSVEYRKAPEAKFPAAHEDVYQTLQWAFQHAAEMNGDSKHVAIAGESAGGNMAAAACLMAKDRGGMMPVHQLLIYPVGDVGFDTPSYGENANAKPLNKAMMAWFFEKYMSKPDDRQNKYLSLVQATDFRGLPPATIITADVDPLRDDGKTYADKLQAAGLDVAYHNYAGVTHEFFGAGAVLDTSKQAEAFAANRLTAAFTR